MSYGLIDIDFSSVNHRIPTFGDQWWYVPAISCLTFPFLAGFLMATCGLGWIRTQYRDRMGIEGSLAVDICLYCLPFISALPSIQMGIDLKARAPHAMFMDRE